MKICIISDLHGEFPKLDSGDVLIICGDLTGSNRFIQYIGFDLWLKQQIFDLKLVIAGNHDGMLLNREYKIENGIYLEDSEYIYKNIKFYGTPWSLTFPEINIHCSSFTGSEEELEAKYDKIPNDVDILISHGPALGVMDKTKRGEHVGSPSLLRKLMDIKPRLFISGHIHEAYETYSVDFNGKLMTFVNASIMNEDYEAVNKPVHLELEI